MSITSIKHFRTLPLLAALSLSPLTAHPADLEVSVTGVRSTDGQVKLMLFDHAEGFRKEDKARQVLALPAVAGEVHGMFHGLPAGQYAILVYHDENGDGKLNLRFGMFPKEGYGLSNNPKVSGPPAFKDSAFDVAEGGKRIDIKLIY
jgi:uncharacterized protein (DUF2141 family)